MRSLQNMRVIRNAKVDNAEIRMRPQDMSKARVAVVTIANGRFGATEFEEAMDSEHRMRRWSEGEESGAKTRSEFIIKA